MRNPRSLRSGREFRRVLDEGRKGRCDGIVVTFAPSATPERPSRLGLAVRSQRGAVARNRIKRCLREAFRAVDMPPGYDVVVGAGDQAKDVHCLEIARGLEVALARAQRGAS